MQNLDRVKLNMELESSRKVNSPVVETDVASLFLWIEDCIQLLPLLHILHISVFIEFDPNSLVLTADAVKNVGFTSAEEDEDIWSKQSSDVVVTDNGNTLVEIMYMLTKPTE